MVDLTASTSKARAGKPNDQFAFRLAEIQKKFKFSKNLKKAMKEVEADMLSLLNCKLFTIYQSIDNGKEIEATYKGGIGSNEPNDIVIRVPFSATSLAGYAALAQQPILVEDVYDAEALSNIHPRLKWDKKFSESKGLFFKSMLVVPIKDEILLGVMQIINLKSDAVFNQQDLANATLVAKMFAKQFRTEFQSTQGPYDYLVQQTRISSKELADLQKKAPLHNRTVTAMLMEDFKIEADEIGKSLELYYRVPYMKYDAKVRLPFVLMEKLGSSYLRSNLWVPVAGNKEEAVILLSDPSNFQLIMEIQKILNARNYVFRVGLPEHILQFLHHVERHEIHGESFDAVFKSMGSDNTVEVEDVTEAEEESAAAASGIIQLVNKIIIEAERLGSSDIHIEPGKDKSLGVVRIRVDGVCRELLKVPAEHIHALIARVKVHVATGYR